MLKAVPNILTTMISRRYGDAYKTFSLTSQVLACMINGDDEVHGIGICLSLYFQ